MNKKQYTIPIFVPHYGCPFDCVFCNQERITGFSTDMTREKAKNIIEEYLSYFDRDVKIEIGFFGGSFTGIDWKIQEELLELAYSFKKEGKVDEIRLSTRPDFINEKILNRLNKYSVDTIELGVQSLEDEVLSKSGRGHKSEQVYRAVKLIKENGIKLGLQMMVGLPGDSFERSLYTCKEFIKLNPDCVRIYPTLVIRDTKLANDYEKGLYKSLDIDQAIEQVSIFLMLFYLADIDVIRVGLQPTDNIQLGKSVIAGPFHPAFKQLVESYIYRILIIKNLKGLNIDSLVIEARNENISEIVGNRANNKKFFEEKYDLRNIAIYKNSEMMDKNFKLIVNGNEIKIDYKKEIKDYLKDRSII